MITQKSKSSASAESVEKGKNLLYNVENDYEQKSPEVLEWVEFKESKKNDGVAVMHYRFPGGPKKAVLACIAAENGVIAKKGSEYSYVGKPCVQVFRAEGATSTTLQL